MHRFLLAACLLSLPALANAADRAAYLPADTDAVITIQVKEVAESELGKKMGSDLLKQLISISKPAEAAVQATGLDLLRDFEHITVGIDLDKTDPPRPFALLEGKFDIKKIDQSVAAYKKNHPKKLEAVTINEKPSYKLTGDKNEVMFAAFLDETKMVVASSEQDITGAFEAAADKRKPVISKELTSLLTTAKSTAPIFARAWVKGKLNDLKIPNDKLKAKVQSVDWMTAQVAVNKDVFIALTLNTPDEATAQVVSDLLGAAAGVMRLQLLAAAEDQPELKPISELMRSTRAQPHGKTAVVTGTIKGDSLAKAFLPATPKVEPKK